MREDWIFLYSFAGTVVNKEDIMDVLYYLMGL